MITLASRSEPIPFAGPLYSETPARPRPMQPEVIAMPVCRVCLVQSFKQVYDLDYGFPAIRDKLLACIPSLDKNMLDLNYCICEKCLADLNTFYEFRERVLSAEVDIKAVMSESQASDDFDELEQYAFEASLVRANAQMNPDPDVITLASSGAPPVRASSPPPPPPPPPRNHHRHHNHHSHHQPPLTSMRNGGVDEQLAAIATIEERNNTSQPQYIGPPNATSSPIVVASGAPNAADGSVQVLHVQAPPPALQPQRNGSYYAQEKMCHICFRQYPNKTCLQSHIKSVHEPNGSGTIIKRKVLNAMMSTLSPAELNAINEEVAKKCVPTACAECRIKLRCMHEMQYHIHAVHKNLNVNNVHFNVTCEVCHLVFSHKYVRAHRKEHENRARAEQQQQQQRTWATVVTTPTMAGSSSGGGDSSAAPDVSMGNYWECRRCKIVFNSSEHTQEDHRKIHHNERQNALLMSIGEVVGMVPVGVAANVAATIEATEEAVAAITPPVLKHETVIEEPCDLSI